jgi:hypothetical protein
MVLFYVWILTDKTLFVELKKDMFKYGEIEKLNIITKTMMEPSIPLP